MALHNSNIATDTNPRIARVDGMDAMLDDFAAGQNCRLYSRALTQDFNALAETLRPWKGSEHGCIFFDSRADFTRIFPNLSAPARHAAAFIAEEDMPRLFRNFSRLELRVVSNYKSMPAAYRFHADPGDAVLAVYAGKGTEVLRNDEARARKDGGGDFARFTFYTPAKDACPIALQPGDIWHQAGGNRSADPFIHRAPVCTDTDGPRIVLIATRRRKEPQP